MALGCVFYSVLTLVVKLFAHLRIVQLDLLTKAEQGLRVTSWQDKAAKVCPQLDRSSLGGCRFSEGAW